MFLRGSHSDELIISGKEKRELVMESECLGTQNWIIGIFLGWKIRYGGRKFRYTAYVPRSVRNRPYTLGTLSHTFFYLLRPIATEVNCQARLLFRPVSEKNSRGRRVERANPGTGNTFWSSHRSQVDAGHLEQKIKVWIEKIEKRNVDLKKGDWDGCNFR